MTDRPLCAIILAAGLGKRADEGLDDTAADQGDRFHPNVPTLLVAARPTPPPIDSRNGAKWQVGKGAFC